MSIKGYRLVDLPTPCEARQLDPRPQVNLGSASVNISTHHAASIHTIGALVESRGVSTLVGISVLNSDTGTCFLTEVADSQTYARTIHALSLHEPDEV